MAYFCPYVVPSLICKLCPCTTCFFLSLINLSPQCNQYLIPLSPRCIIFLFWLIQLWPHFQQLWTTSNIRLNFYIWSNFLYNKYKKRFPKLMFSLMFLYLCLVINVGKIRINSIQFDLILIKRRLLFTSLTKTYFEQLCRSYSYLSYINWL